MDAVEAHFSKHPDEFLVSYREGPGWSSVFKILRDMICAWRFSQPQAVRDNDQAPLERQREKVESTRLFGSLKFQTLKTLVQFINVSPTPKTP